MQRAVLRYQVLADDGHLIRAFASRDEADRFMLASQGETLRILPRPPKFDPYKDFEPAPF